MGGSDGFDYDLDRARISGNIFERIFHSRRLKLWLSIIDYSDKKVLDVGCNTGIILTPLKEKGVNVIGVDISKRDIKKAKENLRQKGLSDKCALVANAKKLPFRSNCFDIVILSDILEHVRSAELVAKEALRVTKRNGLILVTVPNEWHPVVRYPWVRKLLTGRKNVDDHLDMPFNKKKLCSLFEGTIVIEIRFVGFWSEILGIFKKL